jgi:NitT/TauT family transport system ATP-binding protein
LCPRTALRRTRCATGPERASFSSPHDIEEAVYLGDRVAVLNGSPGRIEDVISIALPNPRDQIVTRALPEFQSYRYRLHRAIGHA